MMSHRKLFAIVIILVIITTAYSVSFRRHSDDGQNDVSAEPILSDANSARFNFPALAMAGATPAAIPIDQRLLVDEEDRLLENIYERVNPSVVYIEITEQVTRRRGTTTVSGSASGFVVDMQSHIVTNDHVVAQATDVKVTFADGTTAQSSVLKEDSANDLAVIKVDLPASDLSGAAELFRQKRIAYIGQPEMI